MHLQQLEIVGFKSFADKTELDFLAPTGSSQGITAVVGPNGSGKSNVADALRWVLGEQSVKLLRGKKAEDVIFSGSEKRARGGYAEVTLHLNNEDGKIPLDGAEVSIARRIYRDGDSEYLINKNKVRLGDIQLLLAQANFGARSYSVIGQGAIDAVLVASPQERKEFFDEAAGVKQFQLKRHQSLLKLDATRENLQQAEMLLAEIEPRMRSLARQVKRLEERGTIEEDLHAARHQYYGKLWTDLKMQTDARSKTLGTLETEWRAKESTLDEAKAELARIEKEETGSDGFSVLQESYSALLDEKNKLRMREMQVQSKIEIAEQVTKRVATTMPLSKIIEEIGGISKRHDALVANLRAAKSLEEARAVADDLEVLSRDTVTLRDRLERPAPETAPVAQKDPMLVKELGEIAGALAALETKLRAAQSELQGFTQGEQKKKEKFFSLQRSLQEKIGAAHALERRLNEERIEIARIEARRESLEAEMSAELGEKAQHVRESYVPSGEEKIDELNARIQKLKYSLQLIGGIDPEVVKEHSETNGRYEYLMTQTGDLKKAIDDLDRVIAELDITIKAKSEASFRQLNRDFDRYFKTLFGGGHAELIQIRAADKEEDEAESGATTGADASTDASPEMSKAERDRIVGVEINATPPGKKIKNITMLSGGERAMTSIALICAIMTNNPSPFVVLDEVDAALDESNAARFASIVDELAHKTQFIVITHNRYTMQKANVLYGVTMRDDGTSALLSVNLDEVGTLKNSNKKTVTV